MTITSVFSFGDYLHTYLHCCFFKHYQLIANPEKIDLIYISSPPHSSPSSFGECREGNIPSTFLGSVDGLRIN